MRKSALLASTLALVACGNQNFNKPALLNEPRILAVKAEPPQPTAGTPTTLSTFLYQPPDPAKSQCQNPGATTSKWSWCPMPMVADSATNTFKCPFPEESFKLLYATLGLGAAPPYELGSGDTMTFTNPFPAQVLYDLCRGVIGSALGDSPDGGAAAAGKSVFSCDLPAQDYNTPNAKDTHPIGFKITIKVEVTPACPSLLPAGFSPLIALYSLHLPTDDNIPGNQNPVLSGIFATDNVTASPDGGTSALPPDNGSADGGLASDDGGTAATLDGGQNPPDAAENLPDGSVPLQDDPVVKVNRNQHVGLQLGIDISAAEHLAVPSTIDYDSNSDLTRHYEHLDFGWYAEAGDFTGRGKGHNTGYLPTGLPAGQLDDRPSQQDRDNFLFNITNTWDAPKSEDYHPTSPATVRLVVVVRDGRGGVAWTSKQVTLEEQP